MMIRKLLSQFTVRDLLWLTIVVAMFLAWRADHRRLNEVYDLQSRLDRQHEQVKMLRNVLRFYYRSEGLSDADAEMFLAVSSKLALMPPDPAVVKFSEKRIETMKMFESLMRHMESEVKQ